MSNPSSVCAFACFFSNTYIYVFAGKLGLKKIQDQMGRTSSSSKPKSSKKRSKISSQVF